MFSKINVLEIVSSHLKTYKKYGSKHISKRECFLYILLPIVLGFILGYLCPLKQQASAILITVYSILIGFFLSVIALLFSFLDKLESSRKMTSEMDNPSKLDNRKVIWREDLVVEVFANISFAILVCIISVLVMLVLYLKDDIAPVLLSVIPSTTIAFFKMLYYFLNSLAWSLLFIQGGLILMILKRMHTLFKEQMKAIQQTQLKHFEGQSDS